MASATTCKRDVDNGKMRFTPPSSYRTSAPSAASAPATPNECQSSFDVPDAELQSPLSSLANSPSRKPMHDLSQLINASDQIGASVMVIRALIVFCFTLIFLRIAGRRSFGQRSAFDLCITVLLGAGLISDRDLDVALRKKDDNATLEKVARAVLERNGEITITLRNDQDKAI